MTEPEPTPASPPTPELDPAPAPAPVLPAPSLAQGEPSAASLLLRVGLVLLSPLLALALIAALPRRFDLWVDNGGDEPVVVLVQGRTQELPPRSSFAFQGLDGGSLELVWRAGGVERRERAHVPVELFAPRAAWVWNVGDRTPRYWVVSRGYGDRFAAPTRPFEETKGVWRLPEEHLPGLDLPFPEQVQAGRASGAVRTAVWSDHHAVAVAPPRLLLHVDPGLMVSVRVRVDGRELGVIPPGGRLRTEAVPPGPHQLEATVLDAHGNEAQSARVEALLEAAPSAPPVGWVWTPFERQEYWILTHAVGEVPGPRPPPRRFVPPGPLFRIPEGLPPGLDEPPLNTRVPAGAKGTLVQSLWSDEGKRKALPQMRLDPARFDLIPENEKAGGMHLNNGG